MLAEVSRLFDPLGLVSLIITTAKILIQSLWACKIGWDDSVPMNIHKSWCQIKSQLHLLDFIKIPRFVITKEMLARKYSCMDFAMRVSKLMELVYM